MYIQRLVAVAAALGMSTILPGAHAEVFTTLQFFGPLGADQTFPTSDIRVTSDSKTRDDATARASASASADIGTGALTAKASGQKFIVGESDIAARAVARAVDTLTINGPAVATIPVTFQMAVDGDLILPGSATGSSNAFATVQAVLGIVGASETATLQRRRTYDSAGAIATDVLTGLGDWQGEQPVSGTTDHFELLLEVATEITPGTPFDFESELRALAGTTGAGGTDSISDFGNTGRFTIILPQSYSITSASGVFLAGPIPEPQIWALLACGLGCLAIMTHRRRPWLLRAVRV
jgi:hypothetical protein